MAKKSLSGASEKGANDDEKWHAICCPPINELFVPPIFDQVPSAETKLSGAEVIEMLQ